LFVFPRHTGIKFVPDGFGGHFYNIRKFTFQIWMFWDCEESARKVAEMIINLTQHPKTVDQTEVLDLPSDILVEVKHLLNFVKIPAQGEIQARATALAAIAVDQGAQSAMIGGAPYLMSALERALTAVGVRPLYAFSVKESVESVAADGSVSKTNVFKRVGFVEADQ
jgi:hypothetical protein